MLILQQQYESHHDPYSLSYPSIFHGGQLHVTALEFGNVIRCINHKWYTKCSFVPKILHGILHIIVYIMYDSHIISHVSDTINIHSLL
jgi:hypothetical protein